MTVLDNAKSNTSTIICDYTKLGKETLAIDKLADKQQTEAMKKHLSNCAQMPTLWVIRNSSEPVRGLWTPTLCTRKPRFRCEF